MVSIVIVNYNGSKFLRDCFTALRRLDYPADQIEVILVDNASTDDSVSFTKSNFPWIKVVEAAENRGFAGGNNLGIESASGEMIALLNNDTAVEPAWLKELVATIETNPRAGAATSKILFWQKTAAGENGARGTTKDADVINNAGSVIFFDGSSGDRGFLEVDVGQYDEPGEVFSACGASVLLSREMLDDVGLLDEDFFMYYEDTDLFWRARAKGWRVYYNPKSRVRHIHCGTSEEWSPFFTYHVERNRRYLLAKNARLGLFLKEWFKFFGWLILEGTRLASSKVVRRAVDANRATQYWAKAKAGRDLISHLPALLVKRQRIQRGRTTPKSKVESWMVAR